MFNRTNFLSNFAGFQANRATRLLMASERTTTMHRPAQLALLLALAALAGAYWIFVHAARRLAVIA